MMYVTINDDTQEFIHIDSIDACVAANAEGAEETGYRSLIIMPNGKTIGCTLTPEQLRDRINAKLTGGDTQAKRPAVHPTTH